jgi:transcriptional regulator with PAS, ATPase and Fis domain
VDVNCAALPEHLVESELFGYEKGAFSGAAGAKPGLFELAHTGTLFLDEIGDLDTRMQVKMLRVLDGMPYYRLGGTRKVAVDVRILAATNQDLEQAVHGGRFRRDLYYRLCQVTLEVPPLRRRREDIVPLASFFLRQFDSSFRLSEEASCALMAHSWPGNVRELRNVVVKAALCSEGGVVESYALELEELAEPASEEPTERWNLDGVERRLINEALVKTQGHQQEAASLLGISRRTLSRKLKSYGLKDSCQTCLA